MDGLVQHVLRSAGCAYECLGVGVGAAPELCRKSYLALALRLHPDKTDHPQVAEGESIIKYKSPLNVLTATYDHSCY
jgi:DnaJ-class molecular chaperone